ASASTSPTRTPPGSAAATRTSTACSASTSPRAPTSASGPPPSSSTSPTSSTTAPASGSATTPPASNSLDSSPTTNALRRPPENATANCSRSWCAGARPRSRRPRFMIMDSFDRIPTETIHDHEGEGQPSPPVTLIAHHPEIEDHPGAIGDRACQVGQYPAAVMDQQPCCRQRPGQAAGQPGLIRQVPQQRQPGMRYDALAAAGYFQALD